MLKFLGENYYIDINEIENRVNLSNEETLVKNVSEITDESENNENYAEQQISIVRYELYKNLIDVILTEREELDEKLGMYDSKNLTIPFKIAFNTLLINNILKTL